MPSSEVDSDAVRLRLIIVLLLLSSLNGGDDDPDDQDALLLPGLEPYFHCRTGGDNQMVVKGLINYSEFPRSMYLRCGECGEADSLRRIRAALQSSIEPLSSANINSRSS